MFKQKANGELLKFDAQSSCESPYILRLSRRPAKSPEPVTGVHDGIPKMTTWGRITGACPTGALHLMFLGMTTVTVSRVSGRMLTLHLSLPYLGGSPVASRFHRLDQTQRIPTVRYLYIYT